MGPASLTLEMCLPRDAHHDRTQCMLATALRHSALQLHALRPRGVSPVAGPDGIC